MENFPREETILELLDNPDLDFMFEELCRQLEDGFGEGQEK